MKTLGGSLGGSMNFNIWLLVASLSVVTFGVLLFGLIMLYGSENFIKFWTTSGIISAVICTGYTIYLLGDLNFRYVLFCVVLSAIWEIIWGPYFLIVILIFVLCKFISPTKIIEDLDYF